MTETRAWLIRNRLHACTAHTRENSAGLTVLTSKESQFASGLYLSDCHLLRSNMVPENIANKTRDSIYFIEIQYLVHASESPGMESSLTLDPSPLERLFTINSCPLRFIITQGVANLRTTYKPPSNSSRCRHSSASSSNTHCFR